MNLLSYFPELTNAQMQMFSEYVTGWSSFLNQRCMRCSKADSATHSCAAGAPPPGSPLSPTYGTLQRIKIHLLLIWRAYIQYLSLGCARAGISNARHSSAALKKDRGQEDKRPEDRGLPHGAVAAAQRRFCRLGVASHFFALWPGQSYFIQQAGEPLRRDTVDWSGRESMVGERLDHVWRTWANTNATLAPTRHWPACEARTRRWDHQRVRIGDDWTFPSPLRRLEAQCVTAGTTGGDEIWESRSLSLHQASDPVSCNRSR